MNQALKIGVSCRGSGDRRVDAARAALDANRRQRVFMKIPVDIEIFGERSKVGGDRMRTLAAVPVHRMAEPDHFAESCDSNIVSHAEILGSDRTCR